MYANPKLYDRVNYLQFRDGSQLIKRIKSEYSGCSQIDTILDIGCGSGNLTEYLYKELKPKKIVAFDLSSEMISFAKCRSNSGTRSHQNNSSVLENSKDGKTDNKNIVYYQADACEPFESLASKLKLEPSSVDLVVSFYCLHWVPDKNIVCENIYRFLKPNGKMFLLTSIWNDMFPVQHRIIENKKWKPYLLKSLKSLNSANRNGKNSNGNGAKREDAMLEDGKTFVNFEINKKPSEEELYHTWDNICLNNKLLMEEINFIYTSFPYKTVEEFYDQVESVCYWLCWIPAEFHKQFLDDYFHYIRNSFIEQQIVKQNKRNHQLNRHGKVEIFRFNYTYATIIGQKPN